MNGGKVSFLLSLSQSVSDYFLFCSVLFYAVSSKKKRKRGLDPRRDSEPMKYVTCPQCNYQIKAFKSSLDVKVLAGHIANCYAFKSTIPNQPSSINTSSYPKEVISVNPPLVVNCISNTDNSLTKYEETYPFDDIVHASSDQPNMSVSIGQESDDESQNTTYLSTCDDKYYKFQTKLIECYKAKLDIKYSKARNSVNPPNPVHNFLLYHLKVRNNLSRSVSQDILDTFNAIITSTDSNDRIPLPRTMKSMGTRIKDDVISIDTNSSIYTLKEFTYTLSKDIYPKLQNPIKCYSYCILETIAEILLNVKSTKNFVRREDVRYTFDHKRILEDYTTGIHFQRLSEAVRTASGNPNAVALAIGITSDETTVRSQKSGKNQTPVCISILNLFDDDLCPNLLGYKSTKSGYAGVAIKEYQQQNRKCTKELSSKLLSMAERKLTLNYLYDILKPILAYQEIGLKLRVGRDDKTSFTIDAYPHIVMITGDTKELDNLAGTNWQVRSAPKCRLCTTLPDKKYPVNSLDTRFRDDQTMKVYGVNGEKYAHNCYLSNIKYDSTNPSVVDCAFNNMVPGTNPLIDLFDWQDKRGIHSFYKALVPDYLHTTLKGIVEYTISWSYHCILAVSALDPAHYGLNSFKLDDRIIRFPSNCHSMYPVREHYFPRGIRHLFNDTWRNEGKSTGFFSSGNTETWKLPSLLLQILLSINEDILPFKKPWSEKHIRPKKKSETKFLSREWAVGPIVVKALSCSLDFHFCCSSTTMVEVGIDSLRVIVNNLKCNLDMLWLLKHDLILACKHHSPNALKSMSPSKGYNGIKLHLIEHYPFYKMYFGADKRTTDTELSERFHKVCVKQQFELTNKHVGDEQRQMLINMKQFMTNGYIYEGLDEKFKLRPVMLNNSLTHTSTTTTNSTGSSSNNNKYSHIHTTCKKDRVITYTGKRPKDACICSWYMTIDALYTYCDVYIMSLSERRFKSLWGMYTKGDVELTIINRLRRSHNSRNDHKFDFNIRCEKGVSSFLQVEYTGEGEAENTISAEICHVVSILKFTNNYTKKQEIFLVVCWLQRHSISNREWPLYEYWLSNNQLWYDIVSVDDVIQPAFLVPWSRTKCSWVTRPKYITKQQFKCIPYEAVHRDSSYDLVQYNKRDQTHSKSKSSSSSELVAVESISNVITVSDFDGLMIANDVR